MVRHPANGSGTHPWSWKSCLGSERGNWVATNIIEKCVCLFELVASQHWDQSIDFTWFHIEISKPRDSDVDNHLGMVLPQSWLELWFLDFLSYGEHNRSVLGSLFQDGKKHIFETTNPTALCRGQWQAKEVTFSLWRHLIFDGTLLVALLHVFLSWKLNRFPPPPTRGFKPLLPKKTMVETTAFFGSKTETTWKQVASQNS